MPDEKKPQQADPLKVWTYAEATKAVPLVRGILHDLRQVYVRMWHLYKQDGYEPCGEHHDELTKFQEEGGQLLADLENLGVYPYDRPTRGIALFHFVVQQDDDSAPREAWWIYKDSRDSIDTFVFNAELYGQDDLLGHEKPVPEAWKQGAAPRLDQEARP